MPESQSPGLLAALSIFRRRFPVVLLGVVVCTALAGVYCYTTPTIYQSAAQLHLVNQGGALLSPNGETRDSSSIEEAALATHLMILESETVVRNALEWHNLKNLPSIQEALETDQDEVEYVIENLRINRGGEGEGRSAHVITARMRHTSAEDCAAILSSVIKSYSEYEMSTHMKNAGKMLEERVQEVVEERDAEQQAYREFRKNSPALVWKDGVLVNTHQERLDHLESVLADLDDRKIELESRLQTVKDILSTSPEEAAIGFDRLELLENLALSGRGADAGERAYLPAGRAEISESAKAEFNQLMDMKLREQDLLERYGARHHLVVRAQKGIAVMEQFLTQKRRDMEQAFVQLLLNDQRDLQRRIAKYEKKREEEKDAALKLVHAELDDEVFRANLQDLKERHAAAVKRYREADLTSDYGEFSTRMLADVKLGEPISPNRVLAMVLGVAVGLFCGMGLAVIIDSMGPASASDVKVRANRRQPTFAANPENEQNIGVSV